MVFLRLPPHLVLLLVHAASSIALSQPTPGSGYSAVDPFRALGGERYNCWTCGSSIDAAAARCKDVCLPDERENETYASLYELGDGKAYDPTAAEMARRGRLRPDSAAPPETSPSHAPWPDIGGQLSESIADSQASITGLTRVSSSPSSDTITQAAASARPDEPFLSFEDWKALQLAVGSHDSGSLSRVPSPSPLADEGLHEAFGAPANSAGFRADSDTPTADRLQPIAPAVLVSDVARPGSGSERPGSSSPPPLPSVRSPSRRFNYASLDCSARVHYSSPQTRSPSALLHKSKDRYMLTPCSAASHYVVIELCDEIRIDTLEIGNFEFFSSVVRDVRVRAGDSEGDGREADYAGWKELGTFRLANLRGVQPFKFDPPTGFHRYLRLDFVGHYGKEYYCPVSLVRVYGMNQMEAYRFEVNRESQAAANLAAAALAGAFELKNDETDRIAASERVLAPLVQEDERRSIDLTERTSATQASAGGVTVSPRDGAQETSVPIPSPTPAVDAPYSSPTVRSESYMAAINSTREQTVPTAQPLAASATPSNSSTSASATSSSICSDGLDAEQAVNNGKAEPSLSKAAQPHTVLEASLSATPPSSDVRISSSSSAIAFSGPVSQSSPHAPPPPPPPRAPASSASTTAAQQRPPPHPPLNFRPPQPQPSPSDSGESIYSSIVRRLAYLETTTSLATNYVEAQSKMVRDALQKLEADLATWKAGIESVEKTRWAGGLEGVRAQQERMLRSTTRGWDAQRREMERERRELSHRLALLSAEITLHRWLLGGSLLLLLVLLACFFALRLGSVEIVPVPEVVARATQKVKEKNRRSTGDIQDLVRRRAASPLPRGTPRPASPTPALDYVNTPPSLIRPRVRHHSNTPTKRSFSLVPAPDGPAGQNLAGRSIEASGRPKSILGLSGGSHRKAAREAHIHTLPHARSQNSGIIPGHTKRRSMNSSLVPGDLTPKRRFGALASHINVGLGFDRLDRDGQSSSGDEDGAKAVFDGSWTPATTTDDESDGGEAFAFPTSQADVRALQDGKVPVVGSVITSAAG